MGELSRSNASNPQYYRSPREHKMDYSSHMIETADGTLVHSWLIYAGDAKPTIIFFHGNAGNVGLRLPNVAHMLEKLDANILMAEYRGFGDSEDSESNGGFPNEAGIRMDSEAVLSFCRNHPKIDSSKIFVFGRSLGGAVAFHLAQRAEMEGNPVAGLIVENTFTSVSDIVDAIMPLVAPLKGLVLTIGWDSLEIARRLELTPVLFLAGERDELVPHAHMLELRAALEMNAKRTARTQMHVVHNGTHNDTWMRAGKNYWKDFRTFLWEGGECERPTRKINRKERKEGVDDVADAAPIPVMPGNLMGMAGAAVSAGRNKKRD